MNRTAASKYERIFLTLSILLGVLGLGAYAASKFTPGKAIVIVTGAGLLGYLAAQIVHAYRLKRFLPILRDFLLSILAVVAGTYILLFTFVYFFQDTVANRTSSFFQPRRLSLQQAQALAAPDLTDLDLLAPGEIHLRGWLLRNTSVEKSPLVIFFEGSGAEASEMIPPMRQLQGWSVALVNYRGFGLSDGTPTQANVLSDALLIYDTLSRRADIDPDRIVPMGYSLGTGVAVDLSARRPVLATILVAPYDHWSLIGVNKSPIYAPLAGIMKPYFNSIAVAPTINQPLLCLTGAHDVNVPPELSQRLAAAWGGKVTLMEYPDENHGLLYHENNSLKDIENFLQSVGGK
jgi:pimeloyl-ACP methyl ester carboxylesterase